MRSLYCAEKVRRLLPATTSGSGRGGAAAALLPAAALRSDSLRSSSPRCAAGSKAGEVEAIPLIFTLIPVLALLSNYDQENCLINVGTEGIAHGLDRAVETLVFSRLTDPRVFPLHPSAHSRPGKS